MKFTKQTIYISLFALLYLIVAFSSFWHACAFFGLANNSWMSIILAFAFEIGQAAVLFSLLTSNKDRKRAMPWILMSMFTLVQVIGNVFSSYKYIILNSVENLRFFKEPIFIWTTIPDEQATVIIVYIVGAILPVCALFLTSMITNYLTDQEELKNNQKNIEFNEGEESLINQNSILHMEKQGLEEANKKKDEKIEDLKKQIEEVELDHDKMVDEKFAAEKKFNDLLEDYAEQQNEYSKLKQELEELKKLENKDEQKEEKETHTITFKDSDEIIRTVTGVMGTYVSVPNVEKEGYEFLGWSIDGKNVTMPVDGIYDSDITYIALWNKLKKEDDENKENNETLRDDRRNDQVQQENGDIEQSTSEESKNDVKDSREHIKESDITTDKLYDPIVETKKKVENILEKENLEQVEDLIKNGVKQDKLKESHFIN